MLNAEEARELTARISKRTANSKENIGRFIEHAEELETLIIREIIRGNYTAVINMGNRSKIPNEIEYWLIRDKYSYETKHVNCELVLTIKW